MLNRERHKFLIDLIFVVALVGIPMFIVVFCLLWAAGIIGDPSLVGRLTSIGGDAFGFGIIYTFRKVAYERLTGMYTRKGTATVPLEFRQVSKDDPPPGIKINHDTIDLDVEACKYEILSKGETVDRGGVTLSSSFDEWVVIAPAPEALEDTLVLILREKNSSRIWKTRPFHIETGPVIARRIIPNSSHASNRLSTQAARGAAANDN